MPKINMSGPHYRASLFTGDDGAAIFLGLQTNNAPFYLKNLSSRTRFLLINNVFPPSVDLCSARKQRS